MLPRWPPPPPASLLPPNSTFASRLFNASRLFSIPLANVRKASSSRTAAPTLSAVEKVVSASFWWANRADQRRPTDLFWALALGDSPPLEGLAGKLPDGEAEPDSGSGAALRDHRFSTGKARWILEPPSTSCSAGGQARPFPDNDEGDARAADGPPAPLLGLARLSPPPPPTKCSNWPALFGRLPPVPKRPVSGFSFGGQQGSDKCRSRRGGCLPGEPPSEAVPGLIAGGSLRQLPTGRQLTTAWSRRGAAFQSPYRGRGA
mmetsp:Transcript_1690/g.4188  ORF Transcript_1690/g.4188 Transcript_1690/m.4188 type:complete len:261 (+) Transcript_1690:1516-2298(+)